MERILRHSEYVVLMLTHKNRTEGVRGSWVSVCWEYSCYAVHRLISHNQQHKHYHLLQHDPTHYI